jgi:Tol biopolymer transport system component
MIAHASAKRRLFALVLALALPRAANAAGIYDPEVDYYTLETPHFLIMYPEGYDHIALRAGEIAERTLPYLQKRYRWELDDQTSIVINDQTDFANGSATIVPSKVITVYVTAPTEVSGLEDYDDWLTTVITHELTHIIHLDMVYGLPWLGRLLFGKYVAMNQYTPGWVTEGFAVYEETVSSGSGRGRSSYVDMVVRMAALEDKFPGIDQGYRGYPSWPFSNVAYFLGGRFQLWLAEHYGEEALVHYHRAYAANPIPYFTWLPSTLAFDASLESLWTEFEREMKEEAALALELVKSATVGLTEPKRLTHYGGDLLGPRITPDGKSIIFSTSSPVDGIRVRRIGIDGTNDEVLVEDTFSKQISFAPGGKAFYFQQTEINQRFYAQNSILRYDMEKESFARIDIDPAETAGFVAPSGSIRGRDPDVSPDGKRLVFVQTPYGSNRLVLAWLESNGTTIHPKEIVKAEPDVQLSDPRFSPDGKLIAVSRFKGGRRDIVIYDLEGNVRHELTRDRAQDIDATWSSDGRWIVYASDVTGIYNLYAHDIQRGELRQLTNLISGAYQPCVSPDGKLLVYRGYSADGFDVYLVPFEPDKAPIVRREYLPPDLFDATPRRFPPQHSEAPPIPPPAPFTGTPLPEKLPEGWSISEYSALDTILPFNDNWNLFPTMGATENEIYGSLVHFGSDAMGTQRYVLQATYGTLTEFLGGSVAYVNDQLEPSFGFFGDAVAVTFPDTLLIAQSIDRPCQFGTRYQDPDVDTNGDGVDDTRVCYGAEDGNYHERRLSAQLSIGLPFLQRHFFTLSYELEHRQALNPLPEGTILTIGGQQQLPRDGRFARVGLGYSYANVRAFPHSVSLERGWSFGVGLQGLSSGLGGDYNQIALTTGATYYLSMPWTARYLRNHVLASKLALGISGGPDIGADIFRLGGVSARSAITTTTENFYGLRGFNTSAFRGSGIISTSFEYRAPIIRIDRGPGTLPLTLEVLHLALFADIGRVFDELDLDAIRHGFLDGFAIGAGAELRGDITVFYGLPLTLIVGYAAPVRTPEVDETRAAPGSPGPYFTLGASF